MDIARETAGGGGESEKGHASKEDTATAEEVAGRAADQDEGTEEQAIGFDDPLHVDDGSFEGGLQSGQGDVDHRAVNEHHAGAEDGGGEDPRARLRFAGHTGVRGTDGSFIAGRLHAGLRMRKRWGGFTIMCRSGVVFIGNRMAERRNRRCSRLPASPLRRAGRWAALWRRVQRQMLRGGL